MNFRLIFGGFRRFLIPRYRSRAIERERCMEETFVLENFAHLRLQPLTEREKNAVNQVVGCEWGGVPSYKELELFKNYRDFDPRYISHYMYLPLFAHKLNDYRYTKLFEHKSLLGYLTKGRMKYPYCFVRCVNHEFFDNEMRQLSAKEAIDICLKQDVLIVKDSIDSSGGKSVEKVNLRNLSETDREREVKRIFSERRRDFVIQECIMQHESMARFNPFSINTLRVTTLYLNGKFTVQSIVLRFGKQDMTVDNWGAGGIMVGVTEDGQINKCGYDIKMNRYDEYNGVKFAEAKLYQIPSLLKEIEQEHIACYSLCKFIGWDICFNKENVPMVIELNSSQPGIIGEQLCTGPIFGERTQEVMDYIAKKTFQYNKAIFEY